MINNFPVFSGDVIYAYSAVGTKNGLITGFYYIANYNTRKAVSASLSIPKNTTFSGQSAEWIVERTEVNGSFTNPLRSMPIRTWTSPMHTGMARTIRINYTSQANENITMVQGNTSLSRSYEQDSNSMWFQWLAYF